MSSAEKKYLFGVESRWSQGAFTAKDLEFFWRKSDFVIDKIKPVNITFVGRLVADKNVDLLIYAFASLVEKSTNFKFALNIVGDGDDKLRLQELVKSFSKLNVKFYGHAAESEKVAILAKSQFFVSLDFADFTIAAYEALACKNIAIVSKSFDISTPVASKLNSCGLLVQAKTIDDVCEIILRQLNHCGNGEIFTSKVYNSLYCLTWEKYFQNLEAQG